MVIPPTVLCGRPKLAPSRHTRQLPQSWNRQPAARTGYATCSSKYRAALDTHGRCKRLFAGELKVYSIAILYLAQACLFFKDIVASHGHNVLALSHLDLEHHHSALAKCHL
jgi:hypothetical protein